MNPVILWRPQDPLDSTEEKAIEAASLPLVRQRAAVPRDSLVIGRYSVLPFYKELETDVKLLGSQLINSYTEHRYVADLRNWVGDLEGFTPRTWSRLEDLPENTAFVLKGETNSRKDKFWTHMYAADKKAAIQVALNLQDDGLIGTQQLYIREYVPLVELCKDIQGMPITKEYRFFVLDGKVLSGAFYWSSHVADLKEMGIAIPQYTDVPEHWLKAVINKVKDRVPFFVVDVAQTKSGQWVVVELNDGQMSGLSENDPNVLYTRLKQALQEKR